MAINASDDELERALAKIEEAARGYRGPYASEFAEIARRTARRVDDGETGLDDALRQEPPSRSDQFVESLAILMSIAFPPTKADAKSVMALLSDVTGTKVRAIQVLNDGMEPFLIQDNLRRVNRSHLQLEAALRAHLPSEDELNG